MAVALQDLPGKNHPRGWYHPVTDAREESGVWAYRGVTMRPKKKPRVHNRLGARLAGFEVTRNDRGMNPKVASHYHRPGSVNPRKH